MYQCAFRTATALMIVFRPMEGLVALLMPVMIVFIVTYYRFRAKELDAKKGDPKLLEAAHRERKQLEARIENLESIVTSVDFELNQRLNRLATEKAIGPPPVSVTERTMPATLPPGGTV